MSRELLVGEAGGRFLLGDVVARGGQSEVCEAIDTTDGRALVVKVALSPGPDSDVVREAGLRMAAWASDPAVGPYIVPVWDVGWWGDRAWVAMERMETTLAEFPGPERAVAPLARAMAALEAAGLPHGDLKPSNVFAREGDDEVLVLLGDLWGGRGPAPISPGFAAPERWRGAPPGVAADRFALGATCWHAWTGAPPPCAADALHGGRPVRPAELSRIPPSRRAALAALLHPDPGRRPAPDVLLGGRAPTPRRSRWRVVVLASSLLARDPGGWAPPCPPPFRDGGSACVADDGRAVVWVPPARFRMGTSDPEEMAWAPDAPGHAVTLTRGLWVRTTEVTQAEAEALGSAWGMWDRHERLPDDTLHTCASWEGVPTLGPDLPLACISWFEAVALANAASLRDGLPAAYDLEAAADGSWTVEWHPDRPGWRLPTEAEWEWAAAQTWSGAREREGVCAFGNVRDRSAPEAWGGEVACSDGVAVLAPVGSFAPNARGLHDTTGNVAEWVWDRFHDLGPGAAIDPTGPDAGALRGLRGGSWNQVARPVAARSAAYPDDLGLNGGLRLVRSPADR